MSRAREGRLRAVMSLYIINPMGRIFDKQTNKVKDHLSDAGRAAIQAPRDVVARRFDQRAKLCTVRRNVGRAPSGIYTEIHRAATAKSVSTFRYVFIPLALTFLKTFDICTLDTIISLSLFRRHPQSPFSLTPGHTPTPLAGGGGCSPRTPEGKERMGEKKEN